MEHKLWTLKDASSDESGLLRGYASTFGNEDRDGDVIAPGAFTNLPQFLVDGVVMLGHRWDSVPVAIPTVAREDTKGLYVEATFHSTHLAQETRKVVAERLAAGKSVGLSIGFRTTKWSYEKRGERDVRILEGIELFEFSIVTVPANPLALVTDGKAMGLSDHSDAVVAAVSAWADRIAGRRESRESDGRKLSEAQQKAVRDVLAGLERVLTEGDQQPKAASLVALDGLRAEFVRSTARR